ncbi:hypothetical protein BWGOE3_35200 [Bacillus mycoides]|nr:hypothetical protein BWGOE3_35200 [Bacillus mycoides]OFD57727.1 hypothetical protein BWGOE6_34920 [Bacillus mycoides]
MEIKQLITFKVAAETLNFTQTAKKLNFAQSSVTAQIKTLETELGTPLFERLGKRLFLVVEKDIREGTVKELVLKETIPPIYTQIAWHKDKWMTSPLQQFIDVTREFFARD